MVKEGKIPHCHASSLRFNSPTMLPFTLAGFEIQHLAGRENLLTITARSVTPSGICPSCGKASTPVHRYYHRHPQDVPISGSQVQLLLQVRRFRCLNRECPRQTFSERLPELPVSARQTSRLGTTVRRDQGRDQAPFLSSPKTDQRRTNPLRWIASTTPGAL